MALSIGSGISIGGGISLLSEPVPTTIGEFIGGGYYAGKISNTAFSGVASYYLILAPKANEVLGKQWGTTSVVTGITSLIAGSSNTSSLVALGTGYEAATYCGVTCNAGAGINGYTDWYLPSAYELTTLFYYLKPTTDLNNNIYGANPYAVAPEPQTNNTTTSPAQTNAVIFQAGGAQALESAADYWTSVEMDSLNSWFLYTSDLSAYNGTKQATWVYTRPVRRIHV